MNEIWRAVPDWEGFYEVSSLGQVRSISRIQLQRNRWGLNPTKVTGKILAGKIDRDGYRKVSLCRSGEEARRFVHTLVLEAFIGPRPSPLHQARHYDGKPNNNTLANLSWATPKENQGDRLRHGTHMRGEQHYDAKLTVDIIKQASLEYAAGDISISSLARKLSVHRRALSRALHGNTYRDA